MGSFTGALNDASTPFWNVNVPEQLHTEDCPSFLEYAFRNDKDRMILSTWDEEYMPQSWPEVQRIIHDNRLDLFQRVPSHLRRYREWSAEVVKEYGSMMQFVQRERLEWSSLKARGKPFEYPEDIKILHNDWPYGIDERIVHLVVWTKFDIETNSITDDLTDQARWAIERFVNDTVARRCGKENVIWFRNWRSLQSIHAVQHFHVMLFNPEISFVREVTGGDVPLAAKVGKLTLNGT